MRRRKSKSGVKSLLEFVATIAVAIGLALVIQAFVVKPYRIPSPSMVPTLAIGQRVLTNRLISHPSLGDVIVFHPPRGADPINPACASADQGAGHAQACDTPIPAESTQTFIKRVVGVPGDRISIINGHVIRNGVRETDRYTAPCGTDSSCNFPKQITIPPGHYFMMGDNRGESDDSRFWGPVPNDWIIGVAFFTYWPPARVGTL